MECSEVRLAVSARLDGEAVGVDEVDVDRHLGVCTACRSFAGDAARLARQWRLSVAEPVPDLTPRVLASLAAVDGGPNVGGALRLALAGVGVAQAVLALPELLGDDAGVPTHAARHLGSFAVALAVGFLVAAWRPGRFSGLLPLSAALVACLLLTGILDLASGRTGVAAESTHVPEVVGLGLLWAVERVCRDERRARRVAL